MTPTRINTHVALAHAISPLKVWSSFKDENVRQHVLRVARALLAVRRDLEASAHALATTRLHALGHTVVQLARVADLLPGGPLHGLLLPQDRNAAKWSSGMLKHGWHGLATTSQIAWALGFDHASFAEAADNPTLRWISCGEVPLYLRGSWQVLGGVIDAPLLRWMSDLGRRQDEQPKANCAALKGSYRDTIQQWDFMASALRDLHLRMQECCWMLNQLSERLDPLGRKVLSAMETRFTGSGRGLPTDHVYAEFDSDQQHSMRTGCAALLRLAQIRLINDEGALTDHGRDAVVDARRLLLAGFTAKAGQQLTVVA
ncbi:hypothetical protein [Paracidovorax oryzae]|uniref:hypothetical protein n=1 Tax=Paracidovorax oryzae TaxID=862720 RepID=UPI0006902488|nr:hypothetical protein [Paracidovorax oryzae]